MIVGDLVRAPQWADEVSDHPRPQIDVRDFRLDEPHASHHLPERIHDVRGVQITRRHLVEHGREQRVVLAAHQHHLDVVPPRQHPFEPPRRMESREAAAENEDAPPGFLSPKARLAVP